jgi:hypothetical protein
LGDYRGNNICALEEHGIRSIAVTQGLDTDHRHPASIEMRQRVASVRRIARELGVGIGIVTRTLLERSKNDAVDLEQARYGVMLIPHAETRRVGHRQVRPPIQIEVSRSDTRWPEACGEGPR